MIREWERRAACARWAIHGVKQEVRLWKHITSGNHSVLVGLELRAGATGGSIGHQSKGLEQAGAAHDMLSNTAARLTPGVVRVLAHLLQSHPAEYL